MLCLLGVCLHVLSQLVPLDVTLIDGYVTRMNNTPALVFLAHNNLSGQYFLRLGYGDTIAYQDDLYTVQEVIFMRALQPNSPTSDFIDMESGERYSVKEAWLRVYADGLVLQTCVQRGNVLTWGRLFVIAERR